MDNFPLQNGGRIGIEIAADVEEFDGESVEADMMDLVDENNEESDGQTTTAAEHLGDLQQRLLDAKNARVIRHLTDQSDDRVIKQKRALTEATRPLYFAIGRVLDIDLPDRASKLELHNVILSSVWVVKIHSFTENLPQILSSPKILRSLRFSGPLFQPTRRTNIIQLFSVKM